MSAVVGPLTKTLTKDETFTLTAAKQVNSRIRKDRAAVLGHFKEFEVVLLKDSLPTLSEDLSVQQVFEVNAVMMAKYGPSWFKNRTTHSSSVLMNLPVQSSICSAFFLNNDDMVHLVEEEMKSDAPGGLVVDQTIMTEFFMSADDVRAEAWKQVSDLYDKARERLQRKARSQRHRDKVKSEIPENDLEHDPENVLSADESEETSSTPKFIPLKPLQPVKSVASCKQDLLTAGSMLMCNESTKKKFQHVVTLFETHCGIMENRIGTKPSCEEAEIGMSLAVAVVTQELLHDEDSDAPRLNKLLREFESQGVFVRYTAKIRDSALQILGNRLRKSVDEQHELFGGLVRRWLPKLTDSQASLSKTERATISNISLTIESIFNELSSAVECKGKVDRSSLLWFLGSFCHLLAHACFYHYDSLASSTFTRMGQYVTQIGGKLN